MAYHIMIATTKGLVAIQQIYPLDPELGSVVSLRGTPEALPITSSYKSFVKKGLGLIHEDFDGASYRVNVAGEIHSGNSWQLGFYLAHAALAQDVLGDGNPEEGDTIICATGAINSSERLVLKVDEVALKLNLARADIKEWQKKCIVKFVLPTVNFEELTTQENFDLVPVKRIADAMEVLPANAATGVVAIPQGGKLNTSSSNIKWLFWLSPAILAIFVFALHVSGIYKLDFLWSFSDSPQQASVPKTSTANLQPQTNEPKQIISQDSDSQKNKANNAETEATIELYTLTSQNCADDEKKKNNLDILNNKIQALIANESLCAIAGKTNIETQRLFLITADSKTIFTIPVRNNTFSIPLPKKSISDRKYWMLGFHESLSELEQRSLKGFLFELRNRNGAVLGLTQLEQQIEPFGKEYFLFEHTISTGG